MGGGGGRSGEGGGGGVRCDSCGDLVPPRPGKYKGCFGIKTVWRGLGGLHQEGEL